MKNYFYFSVCCYENIAGSVADAMINVDPDDQVVIKIDGQDRVLEAIDYYADDTEFDGDAVVLYPGYAKETTDGITVRTLMAILGLANKQARIVAFYGEDYIDIDVA